MSTAVLRRFASTLFGLVPIAHAAGRAAFATARLFLVTLDVPNPIEMRG